jgi:hypothetical protein
VRARKTVILSGCSVAYASSTSPVDTHVNHGSHAGSDCTPSYQQASGNGGTCVSTSSSAVSGARDSRSRSARASFAPSRCKISIRATRSVFALRKSSISCQSESCTFDSRSPHRASPQPSTPSITTRSVTIGLRRGRGQLTTSRDADARLVVVVVAEHE